MKRYSTAELRRLEVVNLCDGARLGYAEDFEFEAEGDCSRILSLIIAGAAASSASGGRTIWSFPGAGWSASARTPSLSG